LLLARNPRLRIRCTLGIEYAVTDAWKFGVDVNYIGSQWLIHDDDNLNPKVSAIITIKVANRNWRCARDVLRRVAPEPVCVWCGFYAGVNARSAIGRVDVGVVAVGGPAIPFVGSISCSSEASTSSAPNTP
jgi:hypothetical protein